MAWYHGGCSFLYPDLVVQPGTDCPSTTPEVRPRYSSWLLRAIHNFKEAKGAVDKAKALFGVKGGIWNAGGFRVVFKVLKDEMSW